MITVSSQTMRDLDRRTIAEFDISGETLMERAGEGVADHVYSLIRQAGFEDPLIRFVAGRGNNGGDAFAAACRLKERNFDVEVWLASEVSSVSGDALKHLARLRSARIPLEELPTKEDWDDELNADDLSGCVIVDGVLGTGIRGPARGPAAGAIGYINAMSRRNFVVSIDIPSGLDADTGEALGDAVCADVTVTMGLPKTGLVQPRAVEHVGVVEVHDIGIPPSLWQGMRSEVELVTHSDFNETLKRRPRISHKGNYGHLLIIAGSAGHWGAAGLACLGAACSGAGLITALVPERATAFALSLAPEVMVYGGLENEAGGLKPDALERLGRFPDAFSAVLVGPGMSAHPDTLKLVQKVLDSTAVPVVLDADALNSLAGRIESLRMHGKRLVLTPHPGEMARLLGCAAQDVQSDRFAAARRAVEASGAVVALKGAGTVVAGPGTALHVNLTGNPGMARGGMGDVLAGFMAGLAAQGIAPFDAARLAVYLHGRAADQTAWRGTQTAARPGEVAQSLMYAFRDVVLR